jgi:hypothetical protein
MVPMLAVAPIVARSNEWPPFAGQPTWEAWHMNAPEGTEPEPDVIDEEAAEIDARSPDAPEQIAELIEHSDDLGRDPDQPIPDQPTEENT